MSSVCAWTESCSAGGKTARPAAAVVPLPPAVCLQAAVTFIAHFLLVLRRGSGCEFWPEARRPDWGFTGYTQYLQTDFVLLGVL